jgi:hypothetical protein
MAIVTRYFSTSSAGEGDGTTWDDRAALFSSGNWSSVITDFDFSGSDSLRCYVEGSHACSQLLQASLFANPPTVANPLFVEAYTGSAVWVPPNLGWTAAQPMWSTTGMATIATTTDIITSNLQWSYWRGFRFTASARTAGVVDSVTVCDWCYCENSASNTNARTFSTVRHLFNSVGKVTGTAYNAVVTFGSVNLEVNNLRCEGNPDATSGNRRGCSNADNLAREYTRVVALNNPGIGIAHLATGTGTALSMNRCVVAYSGGNNIEINGTPTNRISALNSVVSVHSGGHGIVAANTGRIYAADCRLRNNTSANFNGFGNYPTDNNNTSSGTNADEFVDAAGGDYRIKFGSSLWGKGSGAGDEPPQPAAIATAVWAREGRSLTS